MGWNAARENRLQFICYLRVNNCRSQFGPARTAS
jgi:hypothetical protein